jgi:hypothetical protein
VQIVHSSWGGSRDIEHIGSAHAEAELAAPPHPPATPVRTDLRQLVLEVDDVAGERDRVAAAGRAMMA